MALDLAVATVPFLAGMAITWRLVWPRWKVFGKGAFYFSAVAFGSWLIGHLILLFAFLHQGVGIAVHMWFCRKHGFTWYAVEDAERYVELSRAVVFAVDKKE